MQAGFLHQKAQADLLFGIVRHRPYPFHLFYHHMLQAAPLAPPDHWVNVLTALGAGAAFVGFVLGAIFTGRYGRRASISLTAEAVPMPGGEPLDQDKLARYLAARDKLGLELVDAAGRSIRTAAIHIADYTASRGQGAIELDVLIKDSEFWAPAG